VAFPTTVTLVIFAAAYSAPAAASVVAFTTYSEILVADTMTPPVAFVIYSIVVLTG
jgi:hypothetical protein